MWSRTGPGELAHVTQPGAGWGQGGWQGWGTVTSSLSIPSGGSAWQRCFSCRAGSSPLSWSTRPCCRTLVWECLSGAAGGVWNRLLQTSPSPGDSRGDAIHPGALDVFPVPLASPGGMQLRGVSITASMSPPQRVPIPVCPHPSVSPSRCVPIPACPHPSVSPPLPNQRPSPHNAPAACQR